MTTYAEAVIESGGKHLYHLDRLAGEIKDQIGAVDGAFATGVGSMSVAAGPYAGFSALQGWLSGSAIVFPGAAADFGSLKNPTTIQVWMKWNNATWNYPIGKYQDASHEWYLENHNLGTSLVIKNTASGNFAVDTTNMNPGSGWVLWTIQRAGSEVYVYHGTTFKRTITGTGTIRTGSAQPFTLGGLTAGGGGFNGLIASLAIWDNAIDGTALAATVAASANGFGTTAHHRWRADGSLSPMVMG